MMEKRISSFKGNETCCPAAGRVRLHKGMGFLPYCRCREGKTRNSGTGRREEMALMENRHQLLPSGMEAQPRPGEREIFLAPAAPGHQQRPKSSRISAGEDEA
jgi:hypothetical protein